MSDATIDVAVLVGEVWERELMGHAEEVLERFGVGFETRTVRGEEARAYVEGVGARVIIATAGEANVAAAVASMTTRPVLAVPVAGGALGALDALRGAVGSRAGVLAVGKAGAINAALAAVAILANFDPALREKLHAFRREQTEKVLADSLIEGG